MGYRYEKLLREEWLALREKYQLNQWGGGVRDYIQNEETGMMFLNLGGRDHWEWPYEYAIIYKDTASTFNTFAKLKGEDKKLEEKHILNIVLADEVKTEEEYIKQCIIDALTYNNDLANERFLKRNPTSKPYGISYVFEEV